MDKTKKKFECEECGKLLKNARALAGHRWFAHGKRGGEKGSLYDNIRTLEREKGMNPDTIKRIEKIEKSVEEILDSLKKKAQPTRNPDEKQPKKEKSELSFVEWLFGEGTEHETEEAEQSLADWLFGEETEEESEEESS